MLFLSICLEDSFCIDVIVMSEILNRLINLIAGIEGLQLQQFLVYDLSLEYFYVYHHRGI